MTNVKPSCKHMYLLPWLCIVGGHWVSFGNLSNLLGASQKIPETPPGILDSGTMIAVRLAVGTSGAGK